LNAENEHIYILEYIQKFLRKNSTGNDYKISELIQSDSKFILRHPNFNADDTAFERLLFVGIDLFLEMRKSIDTNMCKSGSLIVCAYDNPSKNDSDIFCKKFTFCNEIDMLITIFNIVYNFYSCIDDNDVCKRYDHLYILFCPDSFDFVPPLFKIEQKNCKNLCSTPMITEFTNKTPLTSWKRLLNRVINDLYINSYQTSEFEYCFYNVSLACDQLYNSIFKNNTDDGLNFCLPDYSSICNYIEQYYNLAKLCIKENTVFTQSTQGQEIIDKIVNFGTRQKSHNGKLHKKNNFWLFSPSALNSLRNIYERTVTLAEELYDNNYRFSEYTMSVLKYDYVSACIEDFRRWIYVNGKSSLVTFEGCANTLMNYICNSLSSVSLLRVMRLCDKIKTFAEENIGFSDKEITVSIIGYTLALNDQYPEIEELCNAVGYNNIKYEFYINPSSKPQNVLDDDNTPIYQKDNIYVYHRVYDKLFTRNNMEYIIKNSDLIFFIDCPDLYYDEFYPEYVGTWSSMYDTFNNTSYNANYNTVGIGKSIGTTGILSEITSQMSVLSNKYAVGHGSFNPMVKEYLLDFIKEQVFLSRTHKTVYCYLSTLKNDRLNKYCTAIERYNNKTFHILKFNRDRKIPIPKISYPADISVSAPLYFSLWDILKNVSYGLAESLPQKIKSLDSIALSLSWDKKMERFEIVCAIEERTLKQLGKKKLKTAIEEFFGFVLGVHCGILTKSVQDAVCNVIFDRAYEAIHLLLYYRIRKSDLNVKKINCSISTDPHQVSEMLAKNKPSSYFDKKIYIDAMELFDCYFIDDIKKSSLRLLANEIGARLSDIINSIENVCIMSGYTNSNLFDNLEV